MADPGVPERAAEASADDLRHELAERLEDADWDVNISKETLPLTPDGHVTLMDKAPELRSRYGWDYIVYLTDLPRYHNNELLLCEVSDTNQAALVSMPAMGAFRLHPRFRRLLVALIDSAKEGPAQPPLVESIKSTAGFTRARRDPGQGRDDTAYVVLPGWSSRVRLLSGMVRSNRPGTMLPALSGSITAAVAAGAFGVYYSSIWTLADPLHPARLLLIGAIVTALLTGWLIFRNGLWSKHRYIESPWQGALDNTTTVLMVSTSVALMHLIIAMVLFGLSLIVIDVAHLRAELMHPVSLLDYAKLSWMAATLGMLFGGLGSNFNSEEEVREATYSKRDHERRQRQDAHRD